MSLPKRIIAGSDHAGVDLKKELLERAKELGYEIEDLGTMSHESADYPDFAHLVANEIARERGLGLLVCGTGIGMSIAANRHKGVRAAVCEDVFSAKMARKHNDANLLCLGARVVGPGLAQEILEAFLVNEFEGGRHSRRVEKMELP